MKYKLVLILILTIYTINDLNYLYCVTELPNEIVEAVKNDNFGKIIQYLNSNNVEAVDEDGNTLLILSIKERKLDLFNYLLINGADVNTNKSIFPPLAWAIIVEDINMIKILISNVTILNMEVCVRKSKNVKYIFNNILSFALNFCDNAEIIDLFIKNGVEFDLNYCINKVKENNKQNLIKYFEYLEKIQKLSSHLNSENILPFDEKINSLIISYAYDLENKNKMRSCCSIL